MCILIIDKDAACLIEDILEEKSKMMKKRDEFLRFLDQCTLIFGRTSGFPCTRFDIFSCLQLQFTDGDCIPYSFTPNNEICEMDKDMTWIVPKLGTFKKTIVE